jgi:ATP-dependent DNA helicase RecG
MPPADEIDAPPAIRSRLHKLGLERREDLVLHLPLRYEDETRITAIAEAPLGVPLQIEALVGDVAISMAPRRQLLVTVSDACDVANARADTDEKSLLRLRFLSFYGSQQRAFENARQNRLRLRIFGEIRDGFFGLEMVHPRYRILSTLNALSAATADEALPQSLTPVYPTTAGLAQGALRKLIARAMRGVDLGELLDANWCAAHRLPALAAALGLLHSPPPELAAATLQSGRHPAWRRIKFDELLAQQLSLRRAYLARRRKGAPLLLAAGRLAASLLAALPFALTDAQQRVAAEIAGDLEQPFPMQRLLQGDVGCGKTVVAAVAICQTIEAGYQAALMAPDRNSRRAALPQAARLAGATGRRGGVPVGSSRRQEPAGAAPAGGDECAAGRGNTCPDPGRPGFCPPRSGDHRRTASFRRRTATRLAAQRGQSAPADDVRNTDSAHPGDELLRRSRCFADRRNAGWSLAGAHPAILGCAP